MQKLLLGVITLLISFSLTAQDGASERQVKKANYNLAGRFTQRNIANSISSVSVQPHWFKNSDKFWYAWKSMSGTKFYIVDPKKATKEELFDMPKLAREITEIVKDPFDAQHLPIRGLKLKDDKYFIFYIQSSQNRQFPVDTSKSAKPRHNNRNEKQKFYFSYNIETKELKDITKEEQDKKALYPSYVNIAPDGSYGVYVKNANLYMMDSSSMRKMVLDPKDTTIVEQKLTNDGTRDFSWGYDNYMGNDQQDTTARDYVENLVWSPDSKYFATIRWDMTKVKELWVINSLSNPRPSLETYKYMMPGEDSPTGHLFLYNLKDKNFKYINTFKYKDQGLSFEVNSVSVKDSYSKYNAKKWKGTNEGFYINRQSRNMKNYDLCYVDIKNDTLKTIVTEKLNTYVESRPIKLIDGGKKFIQWSERNGWANLYLYNSDGSLIRNLTEGSYHVDKILGVNEADGYVVFSACGVNPNENPYQIHTYRVSLKGGDIKQLDIDDMNVSAYISDDAKYFVANYSRVDTTPQVALYSTSSKSNKPILHLEKADLSRLFAMGYKFPERFKVKADDGITDLYGVMYKPYDFDSTKVYPIIDYVYPGPQVEAVNISWSSNMLRTDRLAQLGFIVVTVGNRGGHPNRSKWYHNYGYGNLRDYGLADQKYAIQQLADKHKFININKVGIHGHSGGGFMSTAATLYYSDFFKAAVSAAGNHDNSIYNRWWGEQHHGVKEDVMQGDTTFYFQVANNQELAYNLKGHLLLVTGDIDNNVNPANTIRLVNALIRANKRFELCVLPGQRHSFGYMDEYFFWKMADWFSKWLIGDRSREENVDIIQINNNY